MAVRFLLLRFWLQGCCRKHRGSQVLAKGWRVSVLTPASQTLIESSLAPDTMLLPSGEKATDFNGPPEITCPLCVICFSALSSKNAAANTGAVKFGLSVWVCRRRHLHP